MLAKVAERHERSQQDGKRQSQWNHRERRIKEQLTYHTYGKAFTHKFVDVFPQELHHDDKEADEKRHHELWQKRLQNE